MEHTGSRRSRLRCLREDKRKDLHMGWREHFKAVYDGQEVEPYEQWIENRIARSKSILREELAKTGGSREAQDVVLITYPDQFCRGEEKKLRVFSEFANRYLKGIFDVIHFLPFYPYSSDDGFSVIDYKQVDGCLGDWEDIRQIGRDYRLMYDLVCNHISAESSWFQEYLKGNPQYEDFFIEVDPGTDLSAVTRPRTSPLLTEFESVHGPRYLWTTFSADQIDLNYRNPEVLCRVLDVYLEYLEKGARWIRLDAVGFMWKEIGTTCIHLPQTHEIIKLLRCVMDQVLDNGILITETNVPHKDNISYFGNGHDESHLVYQFPLPPLVLYSFFRKNAEVMTGWAGSLSLPSGDTGFFNFLASHDGVGINPLRSIVEEAEIEQMIRHYQDTSGALVSFTENPDGSRSVYELNVAYLSAMEGNEGTKTGIRKFLTAHGVLLGMRGIPALYIHSYIGSENYVDGVAGTGVNRTINREKNDLDRLSRELEIPGSSRGIIMKALQEMIRVRKRNDAFDTDSPQEVLSLDGRVLAFIRSGKTTKVLCLYNFSDEKLQVEYSGADGGRDLISGKILTDTVELDGYAFRWISI